MDAFVGRIEEVAQHGDGAASFLVCKYWQTCSFLYLPDAVIPRLDEQAHLVVQFGSAFAFCHCADDDSEVSGFDALNELFQTCAFFFRFDF